MTRSPLQEHWDEFDWERELRKDDERVSMYFRELPRYIDLPAEDEVIYSTIRRKKELQPRGGSWPFMPPPEDPAADNIPWDPPEDDEEACRREEEWQKRDGADIYITCGQTARELAAIFAWAPDRELSAAAMACICINGRIMARAADIIELDPEELPALRTALAKRIAADANELLGLLEQLTPGDQPEPPQMLLYIRELLLKVRQSALDIRMRTR